MLLITYIIKKYWQYTQLSVLEIPETSFTGSVQTEQFKDMISLQEVILNGVTSIGSNSFQNCIQLETVQLSSCLTIGNYAFSGCLLLTTVILPKLTIIGSYAFEKVGLTEIELNSAYVFNTKLDILRGLEGYPIVNFISIPNSTILTHIYFPYALVVLELNFSCMNELVSCRLPMITKVFSGLFRDHSKLTEVLMPRVKEIEGDFVFYNCENLELVSLQSLTTVNRNSQN